MTDKISLSLEDQKLVRKYMLTLVTIPGGILILISFLLGYFIKDVATSSAYQNAYDQAFSEVVSTVNSTARNASTAAFEAETAKANVVKMEKELATILQEAQTSELLTSTQRQIDEIATNLLARDEFIKRVNSMQEFKEFDRNSKHMRVEVAGGGPWGRWRKASYCPPNYYVCGLSQRVEGEQGRGDDTALNDISLECCPLFGE